MSLIYGIQVKQMTPLRFNHHHKGIMFSYDVLDVMIQLQYT
jgi:hypothetical protein